ncbi:MAG: GGDEF domain-containing protein [Pseudomonadales bacterium]|nr:GGDEF domain-containing protein [Pseudomonadales bacterium]
MMELDIATLSLTFISLGLTSIVVLFLIWRINRDMPGVFFWLQGSLFSLLSSLSLLLNAQLVLPEGLAPLISNSLSLTGSMLLMEGSLRFRGFYSLRRWLFLLALIPVFIAASWINRFDATARYLFHDSVTMLFLFTATLALVWRPGSREEIYANALAAIGATLMTLAVSVRWLLSLRGSQLVLAGTDSLATQWYLFAGTLFYMVWVFGISVACYSRSRQQVMQLAREDSLTGLPNRRSIDEHLDQALAENRRDGVQFAVILIDINEFKQVNDRYGHSAGDLVLQGVAERLRALVREADFAGRLGGDEFILIARPVDTEQTLMQILARLRQGLEGGVAVPGGNFQIQVSMGAALCRRDGETPDQLLGKADARMYQDKAQNSPG